MIFMKFREAKKDIQSFVLPGQAENLLALADAAT
jgi:hypothetical protein